jgi:hypothetical protein
MKKAFNVFVNKPPAKEYTLEEVMAMFPKRSKLVTQEVVDNINKACNDPEFSASDFIGTLIDYRDTISGTTSLSGYVNAIRFCSYLEQYGGVAYEAYIRTFKDDEFVQKRINAAVDSSDYTMLRSVASRYMRSATVKAILAQSDIPLHLMFQGYRYKAVARLATEMEEAPYARDRIMAADKLLMHVKAPESMQIDMKVEDNSGAITVHEVLYKQLADMAANQKRLLDSGHDIKQVQMIGVDLDVIDVEVKESNGQQ